MPRKPNGSRQTRALLAAFLDRSQAWRHGYELSKETGLRSGTLYPLLMRLSEQGLLEFALARSGTSRPAAAPCLPADRGRAGSCSRAGIGGDRGRARGELWHECRSKPMATMDREACAACRMGLARCAIAVGRRDAARARLHSGRSGRLALGARLRPRKLPGQIDPSAVFARTGRLAAGCGQRRPDALDRASAPGKRRRPTESPQPAFDETTCDLSGVAPELRPRLRCGTVSVPRSYDDPDAGRFILVDQRGTGRSEPAFARTSSASFWRRPSRSWLA